MPPIFRRGEHTLILLKDQQGKFVLGKKNFYPKSISRMVGGGLDKDTPPEGACRELEEELGLKLNPDELIYLFTLKANITAGTETVQFVTYVFFFQLSDEVLTPSSDLDGLARLNEQEYRKLIERYLTLSPEVDQEKGFAWADYGKIYGPMHQWALDFLQKSV